jgi:hypothetical protein
MDLPAPWQSGVAQAVVFLGLLLVMLGPSMRAAFDEGATSPWRFDSGLARLARAAVVAGIGAVAMLLLMAATANASGDDTARVVGAGAGISLGTALYLLLRARTAGLPLAALSSVAGAWAALRVAGGMGCHLDASSSLSLMAAASLIPGVVLGAIVFLAYLPRLIRFVVR